MSPSKCSIFALPGLPDFGVEQKCETRLDFREALDFHLGGMKLAGGRLRSLLRPSITLSRCLILVIAGFPPPENGSRMFSKEIF